MAQSLEEAEIAIEALFLLVRKENPEAKARDVSKKLAESNIGVGAILQAHEKYLLKSVKFTEFAIRTLVIITYFVASTKEFLVKI